jgi:hypothetical protein
MLKNISSCLNNHTESFLPLVKKCERVTPYLHDLQVLHKCTLEDLLKNHIKLPADLDGNPISEEVFGKLVVCLKSAAKIKEHTMLVRCLAEQFNIPIRENYELTRRPF